MSQAAPSNEVRAELTPGQQWRLAEFRRRLAHIDESYRFWTAALNHGPSINQSLEILDRSLHRTARQKPRKRVRLHPEIEMAISYLASRKLEGTDREGSCPTAAEIQAACEELLQWMKPIGGRPDNRILRHHVQAMMLLCEWASGRPVTASPTTKSIYDPQMTSPGARAIKHVFQAIDKSITTTTLMNIVRATRRKRELTGKRFEDFFPAYRTTAPPWIAPEEVPPVYEIQKSGIAFPIYCS